MAARVKNAAILVDALYVDAQLFQKNIYFVVSRERRVGREERRGNCFRVCNWLLAF